MITKNNKEIIKQLEVTATRLEKAVLENKQALIQIKKELAKHKDNLI